MFIIRCYTNNKGKYLFMITNSTLIPPANCARSSISNSAITKRDPFFKLH